MNMRYKQFILYVLTAALSLYGLIEHWMTCIFAIKEFDCFQTA